jgi:hypothetical protein
MENNSDSTWGNAPTGVRNVRALAWLGLVGSFGCSAWLVLRMLESLDLDVIAQIGMVMLALLLPLIYFWLDYGLRRRLKAAYYVQMVVAVIGLFLFLAPVGLFMNAYILCQWFRSDTKDWFGV